MDINLGKTLFTEEEISKAVSKVAKQINSDYHDKQPIMICVLKGAITFFADLIRKIDLDINIAFITSSSYKNGTKSSGKVDIYAETLPNVNGHDIIVVEDIVDSGNTIVSINEYLLNKGANSVRICTLLDKTSGRTNAIKPDYYGFTVGDEFVIGYGMDYADSCRNLPFICTLK